MSTSCRLVPSLLAVAFAIAVPMGVAAQERQAPPPPESSERADHRALSDAVRRAERETNGQVLSAERVQFDGRDLSRVKVIDERGRVRVYWDDPQQSRRAERDAERTQRDTRRAREDARQRGEPPRGDPPQRTRRHDGAAFNL